MSPRMLPYTLLGIVFFGAVLAGLGWWLGEPRRADRRAGGWR